MFQNHQEIKNEIVSTLNIHIQTPGKFTAFSALDGEDYGRGELEALKTEVARLSYLVTVLSTVLLESDIIDCGQLTAFLSKAQLINR